MLRQLLQCCIINKTHALSFKLYKVQLYGILNGLKKSTLKVEIFLILCDLAICKHNWEIRIERILDICDAKLLHMKIKIIEKRVHLFV